MAEYAIDHLDREGLLELRMYLSESLAAGKVINRGEEAK
jgi:hypothetical protein